MRTYHPTVTPQIQFELERLALPVEQTNVEQYREMMLALGRDFVQLHSASFLGIDNLLLICTNEDADFLAEGILQALEDRGGPVVRVACFWNDRKKIPAKNDWAGLDAAPIVRRYVEPGNVDAFLVVKSIISSACVVRTNIAELVDDRKPQRILIFAPVIYQGADEKIREDFPSELAERFELYFFAEDTQRSGETVIPGIGGQIYERLGLGTRDQKNAYSPQLVRRRRQKLAV